MDAEVMTEKPPNTQRLIQIAEFLYGERWQRKLADDLGKDQKQVNRWALGKYEPDDEIINQVEAILDEHIARARQLRGKRKSKA
jgi:hypothetical protein